MLANVFSQLSGGEPRPPETKFYDPRVALPYGPRNAIELFKRELAQCARSLLAPAAFEFMGMVDRCPESFYDLLPSIPDATDSESSSVGSSHPS